MELVALEDSTAFYDIDGDGCLDGLDAEWGRFRVWRDLARMVRATRGRFRRLPRRGHVEWRCLDGSRFGEIVSKRTNS